MRYSLPIIAALSAAELKRIPEAEFQRAVIEHARSRGWKVFYIAKTGMMGANGKWRGMADEGWPDLYACRGASALAAELKTETGRIRPEQEAWLAALAQSGIHAGVYRPRQAEELMRILK